MKSVERLFWVMALVASIVILLLGLFGASEAFGAGGGSTNLSGTYLNESISYSDFRISWWNHNSVTSSVSPGEHAYAGINLSTPYRVENAGWYFNPANEKESSKYWSATFSISGLETDETFADNNNSSGSASRKGLTIRESVGKSFYKDYYTGDLWSSVYGDLQVDPAKINSMNFTFNEYPDWNDISLTRFNGTLYVYGEWTTLSPPPMASVPSLSTSLNAVPEPSTWALLLSSGISGLLLSIRRWWK